MIKTGLRYFIALIALVVLNTAVKAQLPGRVDTLFNKALGLGNMAGGVLANDAVVLSDGSTVVVGTFTAAAQQSVGRIVKFNADGTIDNSFNSGAVGANNIIHAIVKQADGKYIIGGEFTSYNGVSKNRLARINSDGTLDASFNVGTGCNGTVFNIYLPCDSSGCDSLIVVSGLFSNYNGTAVNSIIRLKSDGSRDISFSTANTAISSIYAVSKQSSGKYIIGGNGGNGGATGIKRLNTDGTVDTSFNAGGLGTRSSTNGNYVYDLCVMPDDKIVVAGNFLIYDDSTSTDSIVNRIVRLNPNGTRDLSFSTGTGFNGIVYRLDNSVPNKMILIGDFTSYKGASVNRLVCIDTIGARDSTFTIGTGLNDDGRFVIPAGSGKYLVGGHFYNYNGMSGWCIMRINSNGTRDNGFMSEVGLGGRVLDMDVQSDGKAIAVGEFFKHDSSTVGYIIRYNVDGTRDLSFNTSGVGASDRIRAVMVLPSGKILIGGDFATYNGTARSRLALLNSDGTLDNSFNISCNNSVIDIAIAPNGKIYVAGNFTNVIGGSSKYRIFCLNPDLTINSSGIGSKVISNAGIGTVAVQDNNQIIISGSFTAYGGVNHGNVMRIDTTGAVDTSFHFNQQTLSGTARSIRFQEDGKILISSQGITMSGVAKGCFVRLNADGSYDNTYNTSHTGNYFGGYDMVQVGAGIMVGGDHFTLNGQANNAFGYVNANGSANTEFYQNGGVGGIYGNTVAKIIPDNTRGRILIAGDFSTAQNKLLPYIASLDNYINDIEVNIPLCANAIAKLHFNKGIAFNSGNTFTVQLSNASGSFASPVTIGTDTIDGSGIDSIFVNIPLGTATGSGYKVRVVSTNPPFTSLASAPFTIGPIPSPVITADSIFCNGDSIQLSSSTADSYAWSTGDTTKNIWVDTSGTYTVSVSINNCASTSAGKQITERTIQPPVTPATQIGCSDSTYSFVFDSIYAGIYGNQLQWSYSNTFGTAQTVASGGTITLPSLGADTTIWIRSRDSIRGCVSTGVSIRAMIRPHPVQKNISALQTEVYAGLNTYIQVANTQPGVYYQPLIDTLLVAGEYGNGDTIHISGGRIYGPTTYRVAAIDTNGCSTVMADTVTVDTVTMAPMAWYKYRNTAQDGAALESMGNTTISWALKNHALGLNSSTKTTEGMYRFRFANGHSFEGLIGLVPDVANSSRGLRILVQHQGTGMSIAKGVYLIDSNGNYYFLGGIKDTAALDLKIHKTGKGFRIYKDNVYSGYYPMDTNLVLYPFAAPFTTESVLASATTDIGALLHAETLPTHISCGIGTGSATAYAYGGVPPYHYAWSNGDTTTTADSLSFGTYTVTVTDAASGSIIQSIRIAYAASWDTLVNASVDTLGRLMAFSPQGTFYSYGAATNTLPAGTNGWAEWEIAEGDTFQGTLFMINNPYTDESTDGISVAITGDMVFAEGTGLDGPSYIGGYEPGRGYRFRVAVSDTGFMIYKSMDNGTSTSFFVPAVTGYDMYPGASPVTVGSRLASLTTSFGCGKLRTRARVMPAATATGTATVQMDVKGGTPPYTYAWSNSAITTTINVLPGTYTVTITDAGAQSATASVFAGAYVAWNKLANVTEDIDRSLACTADGDMVANQLGNHAFAQNALEPGQTGKVQFDFASGSDFCGYSGLSNDYLGAGGSKGLGAFLVQERLGIEGFEPGLYYIDAEGAIGYMGQLRANVPVSVGFERHGDTIDIVKNGLGRISLVLSTPYRLHPLASPLFTGDKVSRITADFGAPLQLEYDAAHVACAGGLPGNIGTNVFGGTPPYSYHWSTGDTIASADSLTVGTYTLTVYDAGGDSLIEAFEMGYKTEWDTLVKLAIDTDGALAVQGNMTVTAFDNHGFGLNSLAPEGNGWVEYILPEGPVFAGALGLADNRHYDENSLGVAFDVVGGSIFVNVNGHEIQELEDYRAGAGYRLRIELVGDSAKMYIVDLHGYNGGSLHTFYCPRSTYLSPLVAAGQASARIAAVNTSFGCTRIHAELRIQPAAKDGSTGNIYVEVKGGTPPYSYHWSNAASTVDLIGAPIGNYVVTISDQAGDTVITKAFLGRYVDWDIMANVYEDTTYRIICTGDTLSASIAVSNFALGKNTMRPGTSGTVSFDFEKSLQYVGNVGLGQPSKFMSETGFYALLFPDNYYPGLEEGLYVVGEDDIQYFGKLRDSLPLNLLFHRDANGVTVTKNGLGSILLPYPDTVSLAPLAVPGWNGNYISRVTCDFDNKLQADPIVSHLGCGETNTGTINANASGGTPPYTYSWNNGDTTAMRDSLIVGTYIITVTDAAANTVTRAIAISWRAAWDTLDGFVEDSSHIITSTETYGTAQSASVLSAGSDGWFEFGIPPGQPFAGMFNLADRANPGDAAEGFGIYIGLGSIYVIHKDNQAGDFIGNYIEGQGHRFRLHAIADTLVITKWDYYKLLSPIEYTYIFQRTLCLKPGIIALGPGYQAAPVLASFGCDGPVDTSLLGGTLTANNDTVCNGGGVTLILSGYSGTVRWQKKDNDDNFWTDIDTLADLTTDTVAITNIQQTMRFRAVLSGSSCGATLSNTWTVAVRDQAGKVGILNGACGPVDTLVLGDVLALEGSYTYQWMHSTDGYAYSDIAGATAASYALADAQQQSGWFRRRAKDGIRCILNSNTIKIIK